MKNDVMNYPEIINSYKSKFIAFTKNCNSYLSRSVAITAVLCLILFIQQKMKYYNFRTYNNISNNNFRSINETKSKSNYQDNKDLINNIYKQNHYYV